MKKKEVFLLPFILLSLLLAIWTGWIRMGWAFPVSNAAGHHGALMVGSFLATLIFLERAVTFKQKSILLLPLINGLSGLLFLIDRPSEAQLFLVIGSAGFLLMCGYFIYRYKELYYYVFFAGSFCLLVGNTILYCSHIYSSAVPWWMAFLLFTIVAERLELSRFLGLTQLKRNLLLASLSLVIVSLAIPYQSWSQTLFSTGLTTTALWLLTFDMAWHSVKIKGQHRYSALLLITGYIWLLITSFFLFFGKSLSFGYDAALHSFFIGFVFSMIFSHAPIILPAVLKLPVKVFRPVLYGWFLLLQLSLLLRIYAAITESATTRKTAGMLNGVSILLFFISVIVIVNLELGKRRKKALLRKA